MVKVKYGSAERHAEIAATRLLTALGFGADRMYLVPHLRCEGCPPFPFHTMWELQLIHARTIIAPHVMSHRSTDFNARWQIGAGPGPHEWARAFFDKVRQIVDAGPCPS